MTVEIKLKELRLNPLYPSEEENNTMEYQGTVVFLLSGGLGISDVVVEVHLNFSSKPMQARTVTANEAIREAQELLEKFAFDFHTAARQPSGIAIQL